MNHIQTALIIIGVLALAESIWGLAAPGNIKKLAGWFVKVAPSAQFLLGGILLFAAAVLWVIVLAGQPVSSWLVLLSGLLFAGFGLLCFKENAVKKLLSIWILNRRILFVRTIYLLEFAVAVALISVALAGK